MPNSKCLLSEHSFHTLFVEQLGWDRLRPDVIRFKDGSVASPIAQKRGFGIYSCNLHRSDLANRGLLRRHQRELRKLCHEHILIHYCETPRKQVWQWVTSTRDGRRVIH